MSVMTIAEGSVSISTENAPQTDAPQENAETAMQTASENAVSLAIARGSFASHLTTSDTKYSRCSLNIYRPFLDGKGNYVPRGRMQAEIFAVLARLDKGSPVYLTIDLVLADGTTERITSKVHKHMSTPVTTGRVYGEVSFAFNLPDGNTIVSEVPVYRIVAIDCAVKGKGREYLY